MRAALSIAALAAGALAVPYKRELMTAVDVVYVTNVVTVTAGQAQPTPDTKIQHYGHGHAGHKSKHITSTVVEVTQAAPVYEAPVSTYTPEAPVSTAPVYSEPVYSEPVYSAPAPSPEPSSSSAPAAVPTSYQEIVVTHHNLHRRNHSVDDLEWDEGLASSAATIAASCIYAHNTEVDGGGYGQNIAAGVEAANVSAIITDLFYNGEEPYYAPNYGLANPDMSLFEKWGHFSQIVWKGTTHVGCATQYCPGGLGNVGSDVSPYFTVCNYKNPGNYDGEYGNNVLAPQGTPTANWNTGLSY